MTPAERMVILRRIDGLTDAIRYGRGDPVFTAQQLASSCERALGIRGRHYDPRPWSQADDERIAELRRRDDELTIDERGELRELRRRERVEVFARHRQIANRRGGDA